MRSTQANVGETDIGIRVVNALALGVRRVYSDILRTEQVHVLTEYDPPSCDNAPG